MRTIEISAFLLVVILLIIIAISGFVFMLVLIIKAIAKNSKSNEMKIKNESIRKTLGETIKDHRIKCNMTQEFVAESIGVSRQAVSKWENGTSDPSTANLFALAKLFDVAPEDLIKNVNQRSK